MTENVNTTEQTTDAKLTGRGGPGRGQGRKPKPKSEKYVQISLKIHPHLLAALRTRSEKAGQPVGGMINDAVREYLARAKP